MLDAAVVIVAAALVSSCGALDALTFMTATAENASDSAGAQAYADRIAGLVPGVKINVDSTIGLATWSDTFWAQYAEIRKPGVVDVTWLDTTWVAEFSNHLADLTEHLPVDFIQQFHPDSLQGGWYNDRLVALPWDIQNAFLIYNKVLLAKYGYGAPPQTWDELEEMSRTIQEGERQNNTQFYGYAWDALNEGLTCNLLELISSHGGGNIIEPDGRVSINNPHALKALTRAVHWIGNISTDQVMSWDEDGSIAVFLAGGAAFTRQWGMMNFPTDDVTAATYGIAMLPNDGHGTRSKGTAGNDYLGISKYSNRSQEAAAVLMAMLSDQEQVREYRLFGLAPSRTSIYCGKGLCAPYDPNHWQICDANITDDYSVFRFTDATAPGHYDDASRIVFTNVHRALTYEISPQDALNTIECQLVLLLHGRSLLPDRCLNELRTEPWAYATAYSVTGLAVAISLALIPAFIYNKDNPVIRSASPIFCITICIGAVIFLASNLTATLKPNLFRGICWANAGLTCIGFIIMMGALYVKQHRVAQIFAAVSGANGAMRAVTITNADVFKRLSVLVGLEAIAIGAWMFSQETVTGMAIVQKVFRESGCPCGADLDYVYSCRYSPTGFWLVAAFNFAIVIAGTIMAFRSRDIPMLMYNETKYMCMCAYNIFLALVLILPVLLLLTDNPSIQLVARSVAVVVIVLCTLGTLFSYKFYLIATMTPAELKVVMDSRSPASVKVRPTFDAISTKRGLSTASKPGLSTTTK
ncbi:G-protein coupled receptors family 3 profile domain-containing protein [Plasmodiophora brassicae]|uniref:G-protein coupled receptors family 3 profile domain-containing protein n=1 Tax=Plasmodiophora brassicae TaxID=37360 RepID=A0A3P3Y9Z4_PLABS|nr:unnamed protein product [Plasmodiophora brassicae]